MTRAMLRLVPAKSSPRPSIPASPGAIREAEKIAKRDGTSIQNALKFLLDAGAHESRKTHLRRGQQR